MGKIIEFNSLKRIREENPNKKIIHCHGVFDLLHHGHLTHLKSARSLGDILVVTVTPDEFVNKGPGRPRFSQHKRTEMIAALDLVDYVALNTDAKAIKAIEALKPHVYVKGPDYKDKDKDITGGIHLEAATVEKYGGKVTFTSDETESSTDLINNFLTSWSKEQTQIISVLKNEVGLNRILEKIAGFEGMKVLVMGEPIIDTYVFCKPENLSSKSPSISANYISEENYLGGSWAVARHLAALGCDVTLIAPTGDELLAKNMEGELLKQGNIKIIPCVAPGLSTPRKTRYINPFMNQRMFELTNLDADKWRQTMLEGFESNLRVSEEGAEVVLALDFGHGLFEGKRLEYLENVKTYKALNVQTNSGNYGYNLFHKHSRYDYLVIDERELRLGMHERFMDINKLIGIAQSERIKGSFTVTLGTEGSCLMEPDQSYYMAPVFSSRPVDTTGAGDAFFAITALLKYQKMDPVAIPFIGNIYAGLKTQIIGNKLPVDKVSLIRSISSLLK